MMTYRIHLLFNALSDSLDTKTGENFTNVITNCSHGINVSFS